MILLIDNYDSFSYNLFQFVGTINPDIKVIRNDELTVSEIEKLAPSHIIISPGPGSRLMREYARMLYNILKERYLFLVFVSVIRQYVRHLAQKLHTHLNLCMVSSQRLNLMRIVRFLRE